MKKTLFVVLMVFAGIANAEFLSCGGNFSSGTEDIQKGVDSQRRWAQTKFLDRFPECNGEATCLDQKAKQWEEYGPEWKKMERAKGYSYSWPKETRDMFFYSYSGTYTKIVDDIAKREQTLQAEQSKIVEIKECQAREDAKRKAEDAKWAKQEAAWKAEAARLAALPGARIGMSADTVLKKTSWGQPSSVNRTTTAAGTREQWVYGGGNYLYFTNGVLTAIQN